MLWALVGVPLAYGVLAFVAALLIFGYELSGEWAVIATVIGLVLFIWSGAKALLSIVWARRSPRVLAVIAYAAVMYVCLQGVGFLSMMAAMGAASNPSFQRSASPPPN